LLTRGGMLPRRAALAVLLAAVVAAPALRLRVETPAARPSCAPSGRGVAPRGWLGCEADPGPPRALAADERLVLGLPVDVNQADERARAHVPGLTRRIARAIVEDRDTHGPYTDLADLERVRGIGPKRLAAARARLFAGAAP
jgi:competence protein ComEA